MMHFAGYIVEHNGDYLPHFFKTRIAAESMCQANGLNSGNSKVIQVCRYIALPLTEPKESLIEDSKEPLIEDSKETK